MTPAVRAQRGAKRRCQNESCGLPFYDLNRSPIVCPNCSTAYVAPVPEPRNESRGRYSRPFSRPLPDVAPAVVEPVLSTEELVDEPLVAQQPDGDGILEVEDEDEEVLPLEVEEEPAQEE